MQSTIDAMKKIYAWRREIGYYNFLKHKMEDADNFHKYWPETMCGTDKYGHFLQCLKAGDIDMDKLEAMDEKRLEALQGQRMLAYGMYKRNLSKEKGVQRYKHTLVVDLHGVSLSLTKSSKRALLKRIFDVGTHYYPETMWKIYVVNTPMLFRGIWAIVKPWLHPITVAKVNLLGG